MSTDCLSFSSSGIHHGVEIIVFIAPERDSCSSKVPDKQKLGRSFMLHNVTIITVQNFNCFLSVPHAALFYNIGFL